MTTPVDILLVDDESRNLDALEAILAHPRYSLLRAQDADTALRLLLEHDVAAIVLDIQMPTVSGFELAQMIKTTRRFRETPIVFLTAFMLDDKDVVAGYGAGAVDYLTKPVNPQILRQKIAVFVELFRKTRALASLNATLENRVQERTAELERSEAALRAAADQKDEFLAVLAHELRNPLAPLRMGLDLILSQQQKDPLIERTLAVMDRQLLHMVRLIDDLLDISRLSRGILELKIDAVDLQKLVSSTADSFRPLMERRRQKLELDLSSGIDVSCDATRISQVVGNLLHNSTKFTPEGGTIKVELARSGSAAVVRVTDSGIGIPAGQVQNVFEMFARVPRSDGPAQPGLGIGLALARRLATMHGGSLDAISEGEGQGSTFTLRLPTRQSESPAAIEKASIAPTAHMVAHRILVIEDNEDVAATLQDWLLARGHAVFVARTGLEGVRRVEEVRPEIVLCDLGLPEIDGIEVCRRVRLFPRELQPVMVALTGWGREGDRRRTQEAGFDHHLVKPVSSEELQNVLQRYQSESLG